MFCVFTGMVRLQADVEPCRVWGCRPSLCAFREALDPGYRPLQQVRLLCLFGFIKCINYLFIYL
jgi:hypothetical protein